MRNQKRSETIFLQYCMFNILPILNFKDFSYCCNFEHNYPDNQTIRNCQSLSFTRRDRSTPYLQTKYFGTVQCSDFILKEPRKNDLKNNFYSMGKWFQDFSFWIQGCRTAVQTLCSVEILTLLTFNFVNIFGFDNQKHSHVSVFQRGHHLPALPRPKTH